MTTSESMSIEHLKIALLARKRSDLNTIARKLGIKNYSHGTKEDLVESILTSSSLKQIQRIALPSFWTSYHNHVYGAASIVGLLLAVLTLLPGFLTKDTPSDSQPSSQLLSESAGAIGEAAPIPSALIPLASKAEANSPPINIKPLKRTQSASVHINRARSLLGKGRVSLALAECKVALKLEPSNQTALDLKKSINALANLQTQSH